MPEGVGYSKGKKRKKKIVIGKSLGRDSQRIRAEFQALSEAEKQKIVEAAQQRVRESGVLGADFLKGKAAEADSVASDSTATPDTAQTKPAGKEGEKAGPKARKKKKPKPPKVLRSGRGE